MLHVPIALTTAAFLGSFWSLIDHAACLCKVAWQMLCGCAIGKSDVVSVADFVRASHCAAQSEIIMLLRAVQCLLLL